MYATYITIYKGNLMPPFYIGHAKVENINNGYLGSVSSKQYKQIWKDEIKNNKHLFSINIIKTFSSKQEALQHEEYLQKFFNVHINEMYINKAITNKKFYSKNKRKYKVSETTKAILREKALIQFSNHETKKYHLFNFLKNDGSHTNKIWINDGVKNKRVTVDNYELNYSNWNKGRLFEKGKELFNHSNRQRDPKTGKYKGKQT